MSEKEAFEKDIFRELISLSVVKAGDAFARISKEPVLLKAPEIQYISRSELIRDIVEKEKIRLIVQSDIKGDVEGNTLLFFPEEQIEILSDINIPGRKDESLKKSLLMEISNILTGSVVSQLANFLRINIYGSVPRDPFDVTRGTPGNDFYDQLNTSKSLLITIQTTFLQRNSANNMPMMLVFDVSNMDRIMELIREKKIKEDKLLFRSSSD